MKLFTTLFGTETNTYSPFLTGLQNFEETYLVRNGEHPEPAYALAVPLLRWRDMAGARDWTVVESLATFAQPAGPTLRPVYEAFRDEILRDLEAALPVDAVLLLMHGAMVAQGYDDCEGDMAARVREVVGPDTVIGVELDLHRHLTDQLIENADAVITYKEYPHVDPPDRAEELFTIVADAVDGKTKPTTTMIDCNMIGVYHTSREPVRSFVDQMQELEKQDGILSVSLGHGFPWGDVPDLGTRILVVTDGQPARAQAIGEELRDEFYAMRNIVQPHYYSIDGALDVAMATEKGPVVLADVADNAGGGAPNDSTFILRRLIERGIGNSAIGCIWDPVVVAVACEVGEGVELDMRIGGKMGPMSGDPVDMRVRVGKIARSATQRFGQGTNQLGDAVALYGPNGTDIVVNSLRTQTFHPDVFTNVGIDPGKKQILVVKSMQHFYAGFEPVAERILYVAAPGALDPDMSKLQVKKARKSMWPLAGA